MRETHRNKKVLEDLWVQVRVNAVGLPVLPTADELASMNSTGAESAADHEAHASSPGGSLSSPHATSVDATSAETNARADECDRFVARLSTTPSMPHGPESPSAAPDAGTSSPTRTEAHRRELQYYLNQRCSILSQVSESEYMFIM